MRDVTNLAIVKVLLTTFRGLAGFLILALATLVSVDFGAVPKDMPDAAFASAFLFHVERALAALAAFGLVWLVVWRGLHGEFPVKFANLEYAQKAAEASATATASQERRLRTLEVLNGLRDPDEIG